MQNKCDEHSQQLPLLSEPQINPITQDKPSCGVLLRLPYWIHKYMSPFTLLDLNLKKIHIIQSIFLCAQYQWEILLIHHTQRKLQI